MGFCGRKAIVELIHRTGHVETKATYYPFVLDKNNSSNFLCRTEEHMVL